MIKINLLESITDKPTSAAVLVEKKVSNPKTRFYVIAGVVCGLLLMMMVGDYLLAWWSKSVAESELQKQQEVAKQLEVVTKEQDALTKRIKEIDDRIAAIKNLRANQAGPSAVLEALRERITNTPNLYLESVEQKGGELTISGNSPNENTVSDFSRSLEFSSGLFSNLNIETQRKALEAKQAQSADGAVASLPTGATAKVPDTINFKIRCAYTPSKAANQSPLPNGQSPSASAAVANPTNTNLAQNAAAPTAKN